MGLALPFREKQRHFCEFTSRTWSDIWETRCNSFLRELSAAIGPTTAILKSGSCTLRLSTGSRSGTRGKRGVVFFLSYYYNYFTIIILIILINTIFITLTVLIILIFTTNLITIIKIEILLLLYYFL